MARGGIESNAVSDPWKKSPSRMLNLSQVTSACATVFNLHCQIFHCHDSATTTSASARYYRVQTWAASYLPRHLTVSTFRGPPLMSARIQFRSLPPRPLFQPGTIVSYFIFLFILFCFANALFWVPRPALPLRSLSLRTFGLSMPRTFLFFFGFCCFHSLVFRALDWTPCPLNWMPCQRPMSGRHVNALDWMPRQRPSTTHRVDTPRLHAMSTHLATSLPGHATSMFPGFAHPAPPPTSACGPVIAHWLACLHVLGLDCRIRL